MKKLSLALLASFFLTTGIAQAQTLAYEGFSVPGDYTDGGDVNGANGGDGWNNAWSGSVGSYETVAGGLTYTDNNNVSLITTAGQANKVTGNPPGFGTLQRQFASSDQTGTTFFFSLLYRAAGNNLNNDILILGQQNIGNERVRVYNNGSGQIGVNIDPIGSGIETVFTSSGLDLSTTTFIVGEYTVGTGSSDGLTMYFDPTDLTDVAGTAAQSFTFLESSLAGGTFASISSVGIQSTAGALYEYDEIRLAYGTGASLADVVLIPEPTSAALLLGAASLLALRRRRS